MSSGVQLTIRKLAGASIALLISFSLVLFPVGNIAYAARSLMTGDYVQDTISVAHSLQETIDIPTESEERTSAEKEAVALITDYISRYRNRPQYNGSLSFTTMQTALNAMAGHYKTFANRPLPEDLKERLTKELAKGEKLASRDS